MAESETPEEMIERVRKLRHCVGPRRLCRCEECRAIVAVCTLAREALAMKAGQARRRWKERNRAPRLATTVANTPQHDTLGDPLE